MQKHLSKQSKQEKITNPEPKDVLLNLRKQKARPIATKNNFVFQLPGIQFTVLTCTETMSIYTHTVYHQYKMHIISTSDFLYVDLWQIMGNMSYNAQPYV